MFAKTSRKSSTYVVCRKLDELSVLRKQSDRLRDDITRIYGEMYAEAISIALITLGVQSVIAAGYIIWKRPDNGTMLIIIVAVIIVSILVYEFTMKFHPYNKRIAAIQKQRRKLRNQLGTIKRTILEN